MPEGSNKKNIIFTKKTLEKGENYKVEIEKKGAIYTLKVNNEIIHKMNFSESIRDDISWIIPGQSTLNIDELEVIGANLNE
ncbi:MAG: hypothetical protein JXR64_11600 [Spirochaetales bacterium]|nr:hypothetical protein [Spirochaetales bacterium]